MGIGINTTGKAKNFGDQSSADSDLKGSCKANMKNGAKKVAPSTPDAMAIVDNKIDTGNTNQYSSLILKLLLIG